MDLVNGITLPASQSGVLVDAHAHLHRCFDPGMFLDAAIGNFEAGARRLRLPAQMPGCLMLADCAGQDSLGVLLALKERRSCQGGRLAVRRSEEEGGLVVWRDDVPRLALIAGRQVVTCEGLEILALGCTARVPDGLALEEAVAAAREANALVVLPWGFGKWWLGRGKVIRRLVQSTEPSGLFLGDNGGRAGLLGRPRLLTWAERRGFMVLPGSDPLPLAGQVERVGAYGFRLRDDIELARAGSRIKAALHGHPRPLEVFGTLETMTGFIASQAALRACPHLGAGADMADVSGTVPVLSREN